MAAFVAAVVAGAIVVLSLGMIRMHPLLSIGLNLVAVGGLAPTLWGGGAFRYGGGSCRVPRLVWLSAG